MADTREHPRPARRFQREGSEAPPERAKSAPPVRIGLASAGIGTWPWRAGVLVGVVAAWVAIYAAQTTIWGHGKAPVSTVEAVVSWFSLVWVFPILPAGLALIGAHGIDVVKVKARKRS